jgi:spore germination cell wall hydrolase CwlJ-like protein
MRQKIAAIVAVCLLISSCSVEKPKVNVEAAPQPTQVVMPAATISAPVTMPVKGIDVIVSNAAEKPQVSPEDANCMAKAIYYEARGESASGKAAIGFVIMNRVKDGRYPSTICGVVEQSTFINHKRFCQFSWYCDGGKAKINKVIYDPSYAVCFIIAYNVLNGTIDNNIHNAVSFHIRRLKGVWPSRTMRLVATIGNHSFYERIDNHG